MDVVTRTLNDLTAGTSQPIFWLAVVMTTVTVALLLGIAAPLALWVEDFWYRRSMRSKQLDEVTATIDLRVSDPGLHLGSDLSAAVRSLHGAARAGDRTRGSGVCVQQRPTE